MSIRKHRFSILFSLLLAMALSAYYYSAYSQSFSHRIYLPAVAPSFLTPLLGDPV